MSVDSLRTSDCHSTLRKELIEKQDFVPPNLCMSVAWDWLFRGYTATGIGKEIDTSLSSAKVCQKNEKICLAIPERVLLCTAKQMITQCDSKKHQFPAPKTVLQGIKKSLIEVVNDHLSLYSKKQTGGNDVNDNGEKKHRVTIAKNTDAYTKGLDVIDPYTNDFFCKICHKELSNMYLHCDGCDMLLGKDYNLCVNCHDNRLYENLHEMHHDKKSSKEVNSKKNHTGNMCKKIRKDGRKTNTCKCKVNVENCEHCKLCTGCSCVCHTNFTLRFRDMTIDDEMQLCENVEKKLNYN